MTESQQAAITKPIEVSFEFFPPKTEKMQENLWTCVKRLAPLAPSFVSVTYGAGGSTRERTHDIVTSITRDFGIPAAAHLTCVAATREEVNAVAQEYWDAGIRHLVALRGDPPDGETDYLPHPGGYAYAADLIEGLKAVADFEISVAAYPEVHPQALSARDDLDNLKRKIDAGATRAITQYFFDADTYRRFVDRAQAAGIGVPIVPGILPVTNFSQVVKFSRACGTTVPAWLRDRFEGLDDDPRTRELVAATTAAELCEDLQKDGVRNFHFYTLNRADLTYAICHILGVRPQRPAAA
ncbi:methylenetetrahydrofolate reductase [Novispirillum itersonii]|uniref:Methylenetetrahydrofolate reductase n=1 Tax=Novispirillum itersonii TaxID=189 RepID=A0A7W9ZHX4_NOVIT|nr:methylenetetrahydrofolate reductase [Novispirillum itersonii]MBB6211378.1 methylenetetrahydrofolate reductase (NADPH) [Novispirillum itersonii]